MVLKQFGDLIKDQYLWRLLQISVCVAATVTGLLEQRTELVADHVRQLKLIRQLKMIRTAAQRRIVEVSASFIIDLEDNCLLNWCLMYTVIVVCT